MVGIEKEGGGHIRKRGREIIGQGGRHRERGRWKVKNERKGNNRTRKEGIEKEGGGQLRMRGREIIGQGGGHRERGRWKVKNERKGNTVIGQGRRA